jgi:hypothetical protein
LIVGIFFAFVIWTVLSLYSREDFLPRLSLWSSLIFGTGSIMTSAIALFISVSSFRNTENLRKEKIVDDANNFIKENSDYILYLPLCLVANAYDKHHKFARMIYNNFNVLNRDVQREVLKQLNYDEGIILTNSWIESSLNIVSNYIDDNDLGTNFLYDGGKYFHDAIRIAEEEYDSTHEFAGIMPDYFNWSPKIIFTKDLAKKGQISFRNYLFSYLEAKKKNDVLYIAHKDDKPLDLLKYICDLGNCSEKEICYWEMEVVVNIAAYIQRESYSQHPRLFNKGDATIDTFEDRYLNVLSELYNLHFAYNYQKDNPVK